MRLRPTLFALSAFCLVLAMVAGPAAADREKPNVLLIVSDDLGYADIGAYGGNLVPTPNLDRLAGQGVRFTDAYVSGPVCAPTRAGLMTGRYQARFNYESLTGPIWRQIEDDYGVSTHEVFLPQLMKDAGYATAVIGKWHLGWNHKYRPNRRGVDHFFGFLPGGHDYFKWNQAHDATQGGPIFRNEQPVDGEGYLTEAFTHEAIDFIDAQPLGKPWFCYLAYFNVHTPFQVPKRYVPEGIEGDERIGKLAGMVAALDDNVGMLLKALKERDLERDTLVVFVNDNGSPFGPYNRPFRGAKNTLWEGGIRVPMIWRFPGRLEAGTSYARPVIQLDLLPTLVNLAGGELPKDRDIDGVDLMPHLSGKVAGDPHEALFWRYHGRWAIRSGDMKLHLPPDGLPRLTDLAADQGEGVNLAAERPEDVMRLWQRWNQWHQQVSQLVQQRGRQARPGG